MIHRYIQNDLPIVLDVNSGSIHVVSPLVYQMLEDYPHTKIDDIFNKYKNIYKEQDILEGYAEIDSLIQQNLLFSQPVDIKTYLLFP